MTEEDTTLWRVALNICHYIRLDVAYTTNHTFFSKKRKISTRKEKDFRTNIEFYSGPGKRRLKYGDVVLDPHHIEMFLPFLTLSPLSFFSNEGYSRLRS